MGNSQLYKALLIIILLSAINANNGNGKISNNAATQIEEPKLTETVTTTGSFTTDTAITINTTMIPANGPENRANSNKNKNRKRRPCTCICSTTLTEDPNKNDFSGAKVWIAFIIIIIITGIVFLSIRLMIKKCRQREGNFAML